MGIIVGVQKLINNYYCEYCRLEGSINKLFLDFQDTGWWAALVW